LVSILSPHHRRILSIPFDQESSFGDSLKCFFDSIGPSATSRLLQYAARSILWGSTRIRSIGKYMPSGLVAPNTKYWFASVGRRGAIAGYKLDMGDRASRAVRRSNGRCRRAKSSPRLRPRSTRLRQ
jgi:hypothetical protein